jgi:hypothetical protein
MVPVDAVFLAAPFVSGIGDNVVRAADKRILIVGENSFEYADNLYGTLRRQGISADIVATSLESAGELRDMGFRIPQERSGFRVMHGVDATNLGGRFGPNEFDTIIFNNPRAVKGWKKEAGDLTESVLESAPDVLRAGGEVHFGVTPGRKGLATPRLGTLTRQGGFGPYQALGFERFANYAYRAPFQPMSSRGVPLTFRADIMVWYRFALVP